MIIKTAAVVWPFILQRRNTEIHTRGWVVVCGNTLTTPQTAVWSTDELYIEQIPAYGNLM